MKNIESIPTNVFHAEINRSVFGRKYDVVCIHPDNKQKYFNADENSFDPAMASDVLAVFGAGKTYTDSIGLYLLTRHGCSDQITSMLKEKGAQADTVSSYEMSPLLLLNLLVTAIPRCQPFNMTTLPNFGSKSYIVCEKEETGKPFEHITAYCPEFSMGTGQDEFSFHISLCTFLNKKKADEYRQAENKQLLVPFYEEDGTMVKVLDSRKKHDMLYCRMGIPTKRADLPFANYANADKYAFSRLYYIHDCLQKMQDLFGDIVSLKQREMNCQYHIKPSVLSKKRRLQILSRIAVDVLGGKINIYTCDDKENTNIKPLLESCFRLEKDMGQENLFQLIDQKETGIPTIELLHEKDYYLRPGQLEDPYALDHNTPVQHLSYETIAAALSDRKTSTMQSILHACIYQLGIKNDLISGILDTPDLSSKPLTGSWLYLVKEHINEKETVTIAMRINPDGTFSIKLLKDMIADDPEVMKMLSSLNTFFSSYDIIIVDPNGTAVSIENTNIISLPKAEDAQEFMSTYDDYNDDGGVRNGRHPMQYRKDENIKTMENPKQNFYSGYLGAYYKVADENTAYYAVGGISPLRPSINKAVRFRKVKVLNGTVKDFAALLDSLLPESNEIFIATDKLSVYPYPVHYCHEMFNQIKDEIIQQA